MASSRALPDLVARIRVDSSGVDQAVSSLIGSLGKADIALAGVAAGIGILVVGGKSMIDIAEKHESAEKSLAQAIAERNGTQAKIAPNMSQVTKATKELSAAQRELAEYDAGHQGSSSRVVKGMNELDKMHRQDILNRINQARSTRELNAAQRQLQEFDVAHADRVIPGTGLSELDQMKRQDIVAKVAEKTQDLATAQADVNKQQQVSKINQPQLDQHLKQFLTTNRSYISDQSEVIEGTAKLIRSGLSQDEVQRDLNRSLDLSALKHISLTEAIDLVNQAEHGRLRGLIDLGITTSQYTDEQGNLIRGEKDVGKAMQEFDQRTQGGRDTLTNLQKDTNTLSNDWQDLAQKGGPVLITGIDAVVRAATGIYDEFDRIGHDDALWGAISDRLVKMANWIHEWIIGPLGQVGEYISGAPITYDTAPAVYAKGTSATGKGGKAGGGPVDPYGVYRVGENGPEELHMGGPNRGGYVVPNRGGSGAGAQMLHSQTEVVLVLEGAELARYIDRRIIALVGSTVGTM